MYRIDREPWGFRLTFGGIIPLEEMEAWVEDSKAALADAPATFGVFIDMRDLKPLAPDVRAVMVGGQTLYMDSGMERSAVAVISKATVLQFRRIAKDSGIYAFERYLDAEEPGWERRGIAWITDGTDPDA